MRNVNAVDSRECGIKILQTRAGQRSLCRHVAELAAQVIDDGAGQTLAAASSDEKNGSNGGNVAGAKAIGKLVAERAKEKGVNAVVFDRGGYLYHGRVKALADAAREAGLQF